MLESLCVAFHNSSTPLFGGDITALIRCAVQGAILQRVRIPPGNCRSSR